MRQVGWFNMQRGVYAAIYAGGRTEPTEVHFFKGKSAHPFSTREFDSFAEANRFAREKLRELGGGMLYTHGNAFTFWLDSPGQERSEMVRANEGDLRRRRRLRRRRS